jgi:thiol:disulfide interchange protein DsbD
VEELSGSRYRVKLIGKLLEGWTLYGQELDPDVGPIPTELVIDAGPGLQPEAAVTETSLTLRRKFDPIWEAEVPKIDGGTVTYSQVVEVEDGAIISGYLTYQTCNDEMCLPPRDVPFTFDPASGAVNLDGVGTEELPTAAGPIGGREVVAEAAFNAEPVGSCSVGEAETQGQGLWAVFGLGLLGGLFALIMPCIFPMIPLTVSFFTKGSEDRGQGVRRAGLYGFFIFLIYVLLSAPFHLIEGLDPGLLNNIASNVWLNLLFFVVFLVFAGSFFGFYELVLPQSWSNRASQGEQAGGVAGILFMALTLALVSFSCTGPILGSLLVEAVSDGAWPLTAGMAGFGVALGLPFALFAAFPGVLNSLPKSGGWLNSVKVVLGFVEVALAFKFLSNADLVGDWDLLRIEPFLIVWMLCSLGIAAYLFGWLRFPHDSGQRRTGPIAAVVAVAGILFTGYLALGFTIDEDTGNYRTLNLLSGIAPPVGYSYFNPSDCPQGITCFKDLEEGLAYAREVNKPVMLDFTGYTCVNCRKMEENVWSEDNIKDILTEDYVLISLYVDDRSELPKDEQVEVDRLDGSGRQVTIDQVGEKWHYFQQSVFQHATQPYYVLVSPDGQTLNPPVAYTPDADDYETFLRCGLTTYREMSK